ncbi:MAG: FecR domain-containing protein [SAR324 cluster bacterium]|nr:FecR domain-containing protein [SAR324 cluster bacterium]
MKKACIIFITAILLVFPQALSAINAVASISASVGEVKVIRQNRTITGRKGLVLNDGDIVTTEKSAKVSILFRDGSIIRLYQNTRFVIEQSVENASSHRGFLNMFKLSVGSLWGKFTKNRQKTVIKTPTATCGIKGTSVALAQSENALNVTLSTGLVELENEDEKIYLEAGKMIEGITKRGSFKDKIKDIPFRILIKPDQKKIGIPSTGNVDEVSFTLQVIDVKSGLNVSKAPKVLVTVPSDKILFPESIRLNSRGYSRITAIISPFQKADYANGRIEVTAVAEDDRYMDIGSGQTVLTFDVPQKKSKVLHIDANSGAIK